MIGEIDDGTVETGMTTPAATSAADPAGVDPSDGGADRPVWSLRRRRRMGWLAVPAGLAVLGLTVVLAKGLHRPTISPSPLVGKPVPAFVLGALDGGPSVDSTRFAEHVVVVNFWASWCVPCREEAATLQQFALRNAGTGVELIGVLYNDTRSNALDFRDEFGLTYPLVDDPDGRTAIDFGVLGVPETFIIGPDGRVMARLVGAVGPTTLDDVIQRVVVGQTYTSTNDRYRTGPDRSATTVTSTP